MLRILAVDDMPDLLRVIERALVSEGHQVITARSGTEALAAIASTEFDAAVVDLDIPEPNGLAVLAALRRLQPSCVSVLASGALDVPAISAAVNRGDVSRVLEKPYATETLVRTLDSAMQARRELAEGYLHGQRSGVQNQQKWLDECFAGTLGLAMQPIVNAVDRTPVAYECLLRSTHENLRGPLDVVSAAEATGRLPELADAVLSLSRGCFPRAGKTARVFINLHPADLGDPDALDARTSPLATEARRIVFEVTERSDILDAKAWERSLQVLRAKGFSLAIDDLGAGYSSLSALAHVKPEYMKVDMSLVRGIETDSHKTQLLELLAQFARATNAVLIAEGVETEGEAKAVIRCGAHWLQGYLFGRPAMG